MKKSSGISALGAMVIISNLLCSCQKNNINEIGTPNHLISSILITYQGEYNDEYSSEIETIGFTYDNQNRLSRIEYENGRYSQFEYGLNGKVVKIQEYKNNLPYNYLNLIWDGNSVTRQHYYYDYGNYYPSYSKQVYYFDSEDKLTLAEFYYIDYDKWVKYNFENYIWDDGNVSLIEEFAYYSEWNKKATSNQFGDGVSKILERLNKNLTQSFFDLSNYKEDDFVKIGTTTFTYDQMRNPFNENIPLIIYSSYWLRWVFLSKNNVERFDEFNQFDEVVWSFGPVSYEYNTHGYPANMILYFEDEKKQPQINFAITYSFYK
jgi:hypothetical protein